MLRTLFYAACSIFGLTSRNYLARHAGGFAFKHLLGSLFGMRRGR